MEKMSRKTLLIYGIKKEEVYIHPKIEDLKSRAETYFRITPKKFFINYKRLIFIHEDPLKSLKGLSKIEKKLEAFKIEKNKTFLKYLKIALKEKSDIPFKVKILNLKRTWIDGDQDSDEETKVEEEEEKG